MDSPQSSENLPQMSYRALVRPSERRQTLPSSMVRSRRSQTDHNGPNQTSNNSDLFLLPGLAVITVHMFMNTCSLFTVHGTVCTVPCTWNRRA